MPQVPVRPVRRALLEARRVAAGRQQRHHLGRRSAGNSPAGRGRQSRVGRGNLADAHASLHLRRPRLRQPGEIRDSHAADRRSDREHFGRQGGLQEESEGLRCAVYRGVRRCHSGRFAAQADGLSDFAEDQAHGTSRPEYSTGRTGEPLISYSYVRFRFNCDFLA